ncbi:family 20 glycosylhydrolase [Cohnella zeiphila]|uniref:Family 20 glycosylhydrolase n=1 Tax=Cohnella zeiphila TaxID=2761120 RepID=A0A7X0SHG4_9BACL|nr:family 20 glycosylhydrolase [Cohnella zeiphila]MBB6729926.1 family 20 glycosylhydrolase [Cohnella zeiphila]
MFTTLPLVQRVLPREGETYEPASNSPMILTAAEPDERLAEAVRRLFPGAMLEEKSLAVAIPWQAPEDAFAEAMTEEVQSGGSFGKEVTGEVQSGYAFPYSIQWGPGTDMDGPAETVKLEGVPREGYRLILSGSTALIGANDAAGLFYGLQTLRQLLDQGAPLPAADIADWPDAPLRCLNYDLRQTFSKPELLVEYMDTMAAFKTNALLIEYEDKFPFARHRDLAHPRHALTDERLDALLDAAQRNFIEVIPLQQTFGHLEYVLGRDEYRHLRETEASTGELCPSRPESFALVCGLLEEMAARHPRSRYLHLGCDEVYSLCECPACREAFGGSRNRAFLSFVNRLIGFACSLGKKPIIWQDILAACSDEELRDLDPRVAVMIWHYNGKNIDRLVSPLASRLRGLGIEVIGAPSVRCFDRKDDQNYPLAQERIDNIEQWARVAAEQNMAGLVGTNWTAVFSLGVPYGIFETSWYTSAYFADAAWNLKRSGGWSRRRFIDRFLHVFHGIRPKTAEALLGRHDDADYYASMPKLLDAAVRNRETASLIAAMVDFETAADRSRTIHKYVYRWRLFPGSEPERRSLTNNYRITRAGLRRARARMEAALKTFQPADMAEHYLLSRFYLHDFLDETLYRPMGLTEAEERDESGDNGA